MTNLVVLSIKKAPRSLMGHLQRIMMEIRPGTFIWKLSTKKTRQIWNEVKSNKCVAICISAANTESGFVIATHGDDARSVTDNFGVALIKFKTKDSSIKVGESIGVKKD